MKRLLFIALFCLMACDKTTPQPTPSDAGVESGTKNSDDDWVYYILLMG